MDLQRIWTLLSKEIRMGATNFMSIYVLVMPVVLSLLVSLVFGDLFAQTPRLGIYDAGNSTSFTQPLIEHESINTTMYNSEAALKAAVERGRVETGISIPAGFAEDLASGTAEINDVTTYIWGEGSQRSLLMLDAVLGRAIINGTEIDFPVQVAANQLGSANTATWAQRLLPLLLLMAIVLSGIFIPASSLIDEKVKKTLVALTTTPASLFEVYLSKTLLGFLLSGIMATIILVLNRAFNGNILLLLFVIALSGLLSSAIGIIMGSFSKDMDSFMGLIKAIGILLYAPGILALFPNIPEWIGRIFPTFYIMNPLLEITQNGAGFADIAADVVILAALVALALFGVSRMMERQQQQLALAS